MGIPHLYTHLRPYARPETFPQAPHSVHVPLFIDGPGLAHHVYQMALCTTTPTPASPWDCALSYAQFQAALIRYLDVLADAHLQICKIYFDGHLPPSKLPTRRSRLDDALRRLRHYHSLHPHSLRSPATATATTATAPFTPAATYTPRTTPLSAPPFILAAAIDALSSHATYRSTVATVPAEAEGYCARDAITTGGLVLTGDSDLLLFAADNHRDWGVVMFRDVTLTFPGAVAVVFRPPRIAEALGGVDMAFLGFLASADPHATLPVLRQRLQRIEERVRRGVAVAEHGRAWRDFRAAYDLPGAPPARGVEPRIAELLNTTTTTTPTMFLPFVWEDPARGSAWDAGRGVRAAAYALLGRQGVSEVCRRGQRIADALVHARDAEGALRRVRDAEGEWWVRIVVEDIVSVFEERGQAPPHRSLLEATAYMLSAPPDKPPPTPAPAKWTWEKVHVFAMAQAAWYSLLVLNEALTAAGNGACGDRFGSFPRVAACIDGRRFLDGPALAGQRERGLVGDVVAAYHARADDGAPDGNENGKRASGETKKRRNKRKQKLRGGSSGAVDGGNIFTVLAD